MSDGIFRKKNGFTAVQNTVARDKGLSLRAKGLYLIIQSHITHPDITYKKTDFQNMIAEGVKIFNTSWDELKEKGYLKVHIFSNGLGGNKWKNEYELLDSPVKGAHTFYYNGKNEVSSTNIDRARKKKEKTGSSNQDFSDNHDEELTVNPEKIVSIQEKNEKKQHLRSNAMGINAMGSNAMGSNAMGYNARGVNNNQDYNNKTISQDYSSNLSINQNNISRNWNAGWIDGDTPIILDPAIQLSVQTMEQICSFLKQNNGIPYEMVVREKDMTMIVQVLANWNTFANGFREELDTLAYQLIVQGIIQMATTKHLQKYNNNAVSYKHVIDHLNIIYRNQTYAEGALFDFIEQTMERFTNALKSKEIKNPESYVKSVIWSNFTSYKIDFASDCHRTIYGS